MTLSGRLIKSGHTYKLRLLSVDGTIHDVCLLADDIEIKINDCDIQLIEGMDGEIYMDNIQKTIGDKRV